MKTNILELNQSKLISLLDLDNHFSKKGLSLNQRDTIELSFHYYSYGRDGRSDPYFYCEVTNHSMPTSPLQININLNHLIDNYNLGEFGNGRVLLYNYF